MLDPMAAALYAESRGIIDPHMMTTPPASPENLRTVLLGVFFACLSTSVGGTTVVFTRFVIEQTDPLSLAFIRYGLAALVLFAFVSRKAGILSFNRRDFLILTLIGAVMFASFPYFMAKALEDTTAARGGLLFATMPLITIVLAAIFRVEKLTLLKGVAVLLAIAGAVTALGERVDDVAPNALRGDMFMFLGMLAASSFNVFSGRYLIKYGNLPVLIYTMFVGVTCLFVLALFFGKPFSGSLDFDAVGWLMIFLLVVPGGALMMYAWGRALQLITPTQAAITVGLNPLTAILLAAWMLSEPITLRVVAGFVLIFAAILVANYRRRAKPAADIVS